MITSKLIENPSKTNGFPKLMRNKNNKNCIILFISSSLGTVVSGGDFLKTGEVYSNLSPEEWGDYNGEVVLKNA